jgi:MFS family permease
VPVIEKFNKYKLCILATVLISISYIFYSFTENIYVFLIISFFCYIFITIRITCAGILVEKNSSKKTLSKNEGLIYTLLNLSFLIGPLIGSFLLKRVGIKWVFIVSGVIMFISAIILRFSKINHGGIKKTIDSNPFKNFIDFFKNKDRLKCYILGGGINFWWTLIYIYVPLLIIKHFSENYVGIFMSLVVVPIIFLEYYFATKAGKIGYKKFFFLGFMIPAIIALLCFLFFNVWFIFVALVLASFGIAMVESTTESYFFDISKGKQDQRFYGPYNTSIDTGSFIGNIIASLVLIFLEFKFIFLIYSVIMLVLSLISLTTKNIIEFKSKKT